MEAQYKLLRDFYMRSRGNDSKLDLLFDFELMVGELQEFVKHIQAQKPADLTEKQCRLTAIVKAATLLTTVKEEHIRAMLPTSSLGRFKKLRADADLRSTLCSVPDTVCACWKTLQTIIAWPRLLEGVSEGQREVLGRWNRWVRIGEKSKDPGNSRKRKRR